MFQVDRLALNAVATWCGRYPTSKLRQRRNSRKPSVWRGWPVEARSPNEAVSAVGKLSG